MKISLHYYSGAVHQKPLMELMAAGLSRHGLPAIMSEDDTPVSSDLIIMWGRKQQAVIDFAAAHNTPVLVMERGHIQPRMIWTSCGFGGLGRRARYPTSIDNGERWNKHFAQHLKPWRTNGTYALVCGQMPNDVAVQNFDIRTWTQNVINFLREHGFAVRYRPHPYVGIIDETWLPINADISNSPLAKDVFDPSTLADDLRDASMVVTYNSTSGVESVLAGIPTITFDQGAMAWPVTSHSLEEPLVTPDRTAWCHDLAWTQWLPHEIEDGSAWAALKTCIES